MENMRRREYLSQLELMVLLAILRIRDAAYGVPIAREIERQSRRDVSMAGIYDTLERLENKGLVTSRRGTPMPERGGKARTYFAVTTAGLKDLRTTSETLSRLSAGLMELKVVTA